MARWPRLITFAIPVLGTFLLAAADRLDRFNLLQRHDRHGDVSEVITKRDWSMRRAEIVRGMETVMGRMPGAEKRCALDVRIEDEIDCGTYVRRLVTYSSEPRSRTPAYLLIPRAAMSGKQKLPAVLALHPTDDTFGHRVLVEPLRDHYPAYAVELAERGFVVLAPAYPLLADYRPDLAGLGWQSGTLKAVWDNRRGLDLLESLPFVQRRRGFGALGHSLGGHNAIFTAVFDERIKAIVSSCGFDSFLDYYDGTEEVWQAERGWVATRYMAKLEGYRGRLGDIPFDFPELLAALAPRAVFVNAPLRDPNFRWQSVDACVRAALPIYQLLGRPGNLRVVHPDRLHEFPEEARRAAYELLERELK